MKTYDDASSDRGAGTSAASARAGALGKPAATGDGGRACAAPGSSGPVDVVDDWIDLLRWHNGGRWSRRSWPLLDPGHVLGVRETIEHYELLCGVTEEWQWHRSWLPITHDSWSQCGIELGGEHRGLIVDGSFPDPPLALAPSLVAMLHATCAVIEAGLQDDEPVRLPHAYVRVRQKELIDPIYALYGEIPADLPPA